MYPLRQERERRERDAGGESEEAAKELELFGCVLGCANHFLFAPVAALVSAAEDGDAMANLSR